MPTNSIYGTKVSNAASIERKQALISFIQDPRPVLRQKRKQIPLSFVQELHREQRQNEN